eukprot:9687151-Prorocentrum_lima.AAC.1
MTSSLVGSEMCIRDRRRSQHLQGYVRPSSQRRRGTPLQPKRNMPSTPWPVSYTHLTLPTICSV